MSFAEIFVAMGKGQCAYISLIMSSDNAIQMVATCLKYRLDITYIFPCCLDRQDYVAKA